MDGNSNPSNPQTLEEPCDETRAAEDVNSPPTGSLEQVQIAWQRSWQFKIIEWLKASAGLAAVIALVIAFYFNSRQMVQLSASRDDERFDKAISRLGSQSPSERIAGLAGLQLLLEPSQKSRHEAVLLFLANAVAVEKDTTVRSAILDTFANLRQYHVDPEVLNHILAAERDRNKGILEYLHARFRARLEENTSDIFEKGNDETGLGKVSPEDLAPLQATAAALASLVRAGAYLQDLSAIYCVSCNFSSSDASVNLSSTKFDGGLLRAANFTKANLENASFDGADLVRADFTSANLRNARLTDPPLIEPSIQAIVIGKALWAATGPVFECADLTGTDFTGSTMFGFYWTDVNGAGYFPRWFGANLNGAKLGSFTIFIAVPPEVADRGKIPGRSFDSVFPIKSLQAGGYDTAVEGWNKGQYRIISYRVGSDFRFTGQIPPEMWPSVYAALNSFASAKNLDKADMPAGLRAFLSANEKAFSTPIITTTCPAIFFPHLTLP
jgi:uncharacterized protein YjbI with pentapeptide repeats